MTSRFQAKLLAQRALFQRIQSSKKRSKLQAGFTLIELLVTIVIIGVLAAIAIPGFLSQSEKAKKEAGNSWAAAQAKSCAVQKVSGDDGEFTDGPDGETAPTVAGCTAGAPFTIGSNKGDKTFTVSSSGGVSF